MIFVRVYYSGISQTPKRLGFNGESMKMLMSSKARKFDEVPKSECSDLTMVSGEVVKIVLGREKPSGKRFVS